jgi:hypothetical protein
MTTTQMIQAFGVGYDIVNLEGPGYENEEILVLLNQAQSIEVLKELGSGRLVHITNLIENELGTLTAPAHNYTTSLLFTPAEEYIGYISSKTKVTRATYKPITVAAWVENILIDKIMSGKYITNPLSRPILLQPRVYEDEDRTLTLLIDQHTTVAGFEDFYLEYMRKPVDIATGVNCEVNEILHDRIVKTAIDLAKKIFNPNEAATSIQANELMNRPEV